MKRDHVAWMEKGNWNREKKMQNLQRAVEIAIESGDDDNEKSSSRRQEEIRVALLKDPHRYVTRSFLDRSRTALVYHEWTFCTFDIVRRYRLAFQREGVAMRRDASCGLHDRRS